MRRSFRLVTLIAGLLALTNLQSCDKIDQPEESFVYPEVLVLFSPDGLGDMSYNDEVLRGIELFMNEKDPKFYISFLAPEDLEDVEFLIQMWWDEKDYTYEEDGTIPRKLLVLASSEYADIARNVVDLSQINMDFSILAFETEDNGDASDPIRTFEFSLYGTSWLAGRTAREMGCQFPLVLLGNGSNETTFDGVDGFMDGFAKGAAIDALADDWSGYGMAMEAYQKMYEWDGRFDFIYSISGGSNMGIYRYLRENPDCGIYTAGMDVDQSAYSTLIVGSMIKRIDLVLYDYLKNWYYQKEVPSHQIFGLESGYMSWEIPERYSKYWSVIYPLKQEAIAKEKEYEASGK